MNETCKNCENFNPLIVEDEGYCPVLGKLVSKFSFCENLAPIKEETTSHFRSYPKYKIEKTLFGNGRIDYAVYRNINTNDSPYKDYVTMGRFKTIEEARISHSDRQDIR